MFLIRLCLLVCVNLFLYAECSIPVERLCANPTCNEPISRARGSIKYTSGEKGVLSFALGQEITIISKSKNKGDYWGAVINGKVGFVPSNFVKENKILHETAKLISVPLTPPNVSADASSGVKQTVGHNLNEANKPNQFGALPNDLKNVNTVEKPIKPAETYKIVEGTTIYMDETDEIKPSVTIDLKSTQTAAPSNVGSKVVTQEAERATIPPELINLNSNINAGNLENYTVENVKENDENTIIESRDINAEEGEDEEEDDEGDDDGGDDDEEEEEDEGDDTGDELSIQVKGDQFQKLNGRDDIGRVNANENSVNEIPNSEYASGVKQNVADAPMNIKNSVTSQVSMSVGDNKSETPVEQNSQEPPQHPGGFFAKKFPKPQAIMSEFPGDTTPPAPQMDGGVTSTPFGAGVAADMSPGTFATQKHASESPTTSGIPADGTTPPGMLQMGAGVMSTPQTIVGAGAAEVTSGTTPPQNPAEKPITSAGGTPSPPVMPQMGPTSQQDPAEKQMKPITSAGGTPSPPVMSQMGPSTPQTIIGAGVAAEVTTAAFASTPQSEEMPVTSEFPTGGTTPPPPVIPQVGPGVMSTPQTIVGGAVAAEMATGTFSTTPESEGKPVRPMTSEFPTDGTTPQMEAGVTPQVRVEAGVAAEMTTETFAKATGSAVPETKDQMSATPQTPDGTADLIQEKVEVTTEFSPAVPAEVVTEQTFPKEDTIPATPQPETGTQFLASSQTPDITPDLIEEKVEITTESLATPFVPAEVVTEQTFPKEDPKDTENAETHEQTSEDAADQPGMLAQITGMFSGWFTSAPREEFPEERPNYDAAFQDFPTTEKTETTFGQSEAQSGTCENPELGFDCKEFGSGEEQSAFWSDWIPAGLGLENILRQSSTPIYLVVTAVTVLLFTLGHNLIEKRGKTAPLIAKINKLEQELLVISKECIMFKDEVQFAREKITLYENSANDELVVSLQAELEESKKARAELEASIEVLQQELDAATEAGLDLNKMLSEVLTQKGGSESLLKSVESLQGQLDSQQKVIDEMTKKLGVKNQENETLQSALEAANDKSENLEEELADIKHNLNLHLKEKEDVTRDLNTRIHQLTASSNQLRQTKDEEISKLNKQLEELQAKFSETSSALTVKEEEVKALKESMKHLKGKGDVKMDAVFDFSRVKAELAKEVKEKQALLEKLKKEEQSRKALAEQVKGFESEMQKLKKSYEEAEQKKDEAEKKLEVLSTYFKEKETQLQKELGLQEALWAQKKGDENAVCNMMKSLQEEVESYKSQNETLKKEILDQERGLKNQIAVLEQKAHENWVAARQAERKLEESKQEMSQLRNRLLTLMDKNNSNAEGKGNRSEELNGVEAVSPILHDTSSPLLFPPLPLDPNSSNLLPPGFIPPPMFMPPPMGGFMPPPPFLPGDRRPPPLGRMSSPPLNSRFSPSSPGDYPFERMSSPPLSPPGSNYRSLNEDREHYRHRTPPYPPPLHPRNWDDSGEMPGFIPISSQRDSRRDHKGSNISSEHSSSESLDKSSRHSGRV